jgi:phosphoribosyl 1,2-cyclic phosphodiesterase
MGFPFFKPAYSDKFKISVRGGQDATKCLREYLAHQMEPPYFPVKFDLLKARFDFADDDPQRKEIGGAQVFSIPISHPNGGFGFKFVETGKKFVFMTDNELGMVHDNGKSVADYVAFCRNADLVFHDAQYTREQYENMTRGWGHSTIEQLIDFAVKANIKRLGMIHHDIAHDDEKIDELVTLCRSEIKKSGTSIDCIGIKEGMELSV